MESSGLRLDILRFMVACEQFLAFVHLNGGPSGLTLDERRRIMTYQKIIAALVSGHENTSQKTDINAA
jgi:hypothetical protein